MSENFTNKNIQNICNLVGLFLIVKLFCILQIKGNVHIVFCLKNYYISYVFITLNFEKKNERNNRNY